MKVSQEPATPAPFSISPKSRSRFTVDRLHVYYQFQNKDDLKAARIEAVRRTEEYVEQPKTSQRREGLAMELE